jgi:hypothetical protein
MQLSPSAKNDDQGVIPHTKASALELAEQVAQGVKTTVSEAVAWAEAKAGKLSAKEEDGTGPHGSLATCAPSDFDAIATGVLPAMLSNEVRDGDQKQKGPNGSEQEKGRVRDSAPAA